MNHDSLLRSFAAAISAAAAVAGCDSSHPIPGGCFPSKDVTAPLTDIATAPDGGPSTPDGGPVAVGDYLDLGTCTVVCSRSDNECRVLAIEGTQATIECIPGCVGGRRPAGYRARAHEGAASLGSHFARMAALERASVVAFRRLSTELARHRAPRRLVEACRRAARDERRHGRSVGALARRYGAAVPRCDLGPAAVRSLEEIATENAVEGCVRETFGALLAHWQAGNAEDRVVRGVMKRVARDETRHAALSWAVDAWARSRLAPAARRRVDEARRSEAYALASSPAGPSIAGARDAGFPSPEQLVRLAEAIGEMASAGRERGAFDQTRLPLPLVQRGDRRRCGPRGV
jgi:hypothetical protein